MTYPLQYLGDGEFKTVNKYHARAADKDLVIGEVLTWQQVQERSLKSHNHFFASVHDAWLNLPESVSVEFPSDESLRKYALIKAGYCTVKKIVCANNKEANVVVALMSELDAFLICEVSNNVATVYRAQSQSVKSMGKDTFQKSKTAVLEILSEMIGAKVSEAA
jgi:hypothetical protein